MKYIEEMSRKGISYKKYNSEFGAKILGKFGWKEGEGLGKTKNGITEAIQIKRREENIGLGKTKKQVLWNDKWWENSYNNILKGMKTLKNEDKNGYNLRNGKEKNNERKNSEESISRKRKNSINSSGKKERKDSINSVNKKERKNSISSNNKNKIKNKKSRKNSKDSLNNNSSSMLKKKRKITFIDI